MAGTEHRGGVVDVDDVAARLTKARDDRTAVPSFADELPGLDLAAAYAVQRLLREQAGPQVGWKLGVTSRAKQQQVGVSEPIRGFLAAEHALDIGAPLLVGAHIQPRAEPEVVFVMARDLESPAATAADVLAATGAVAVGIEVLDSRYLDYRFTMPDVVADNASAARFVVGSPVPVAGIDLRLVGVVLEHNGDVVATASGAAALGHPAAAVAWLVRSLAADGEGLRAGQIVLSGGLTAAVPVAAGDVVVASIDRLGTLEARLRLTMAAGPSQAREGYETVPLGDPAGRTRWTVRHGDRMLAVFVVDGRLHAVDATCPHRGGPLAEGLLRGGVLVCPSHWYRFDLATGRCLTTPRHSLTTYEVVVEGGVPSALVPMAAPARTWSEILRAHARGRTGAP